MNVKYLTRDKRFTVEFTNVDNKGLFEALGEFQEIFEGHSCGHCKSDNLAYSTRVVDDNKYYELRCRECGYQFAFGQHKKGGTLFPKFKNEHGEKGKKGWFKWTPDGDKK